MVSRALAPHRTLDFVEENFNSLFATAHNNHQQQQVERD
jgi:hypothetical protein